MASSLYGWWSSFCDKSPLFKFLVMAVMCMMVALVVALEMQKHFELLAANEEADFLKLAAKFSSVHELFAWQYLTGALPPAESLRLLEEVEDELFEDEVFRNYLSSLMCVITDNWVENEMYSVITRLDICGFDNNFWSVTWVQVVVDGYVSMEGWYELFWETVIKMGFYNLGSLNVVCEIKAELFNTLWMVWLQVLVVTVGFMWARGVGPRLRPDQMSDIIWRDLLVYLSCGLMLMMLVL